MTTTPALAALSDLVHTARSRAASEAAQVGIHEAKAIQLATIATTLDGARTRLVEDGDEYLDAAWAFVDAARAMLADADAVALARAGVIV